MGRQDVEGYQVVITSGHQAGQKSVILKDQAKLVRSEPARAPESKPEPKKEPWRMTREEYEKVWTTPERKGQTYTRPNGDILVSEGKSGEVGLGWTYKIRNTTTSKTMNMTLREFQDYVGWPEGKTHRGVVYDALMEGKPVPESVLKAHPDLPDLVRQEKAKGEAGSTPKETTNWQRAQAEASERIEAIENEWVAKSHVGTTKEQQARVDATIVEVAKKHHVPASTLRKAVLWEAAPTKPESRERMTVEQLEEWIKSQPESAKSKVAEAEKAREESHREYRPHYNPLARAGERWKLRNYYGDFVKDANGLEAKFRSQEQATAYLKRKAKPEPTPKPEPEHKKEEVKIKLIGKQDTFYIGEGMAGRGVAFKPVKGRRVMVPGYEDYEFFAHGKTGAWKVTDAKTGAALTRFTNTTKDAIAQAKENLDKFGGKAAFDKRRAEMVKESGVSPQFKTEAEPKAKPESKPGPEAKKEEGMTEIKVGLDILKRKPKVSPLKGKALTEVKGISGRPMRVPLNEVEVTHPVAGANAFWYNNKRIVLTPEQQAKGLPGPKAEPLEVKAKAMGLAESQLAQAKKEGVTTELGLRRIEKNTRKEAKSFPPRPSGIQIKQSDRAIAIDRSLLAKQVVSVEDSRWLKRPNRFDVRGIDTPGHGRIVPGVAYADRGKQRLSRKHHRGFKRIKFT
jgi:hypothetical protein